MIEGGCFCGAVRYKIDGALDRARACHCSRCRKAFSGASSAYAEIADGSKFIWVIGKDELTSASPKTPVFRLALDSVSDKLDQMMGLLTTNQKQTEEALDILRRMEQNDVNNNNIAVFEKYLIALKEINFAKEKLDSLRVDPENEVLRSDAAAYTQNAVSNFEYQSGIDLFHLYGPSLADRRFNHIYIYPGYFTSLTLRVAYIQHQKGPRGFTQEPLRTELKASAAKLRWLVEEISSVQLAPTESGDILQPDMTYRFEIRYPELTSREKNLVAYYRIMRPYGHTDDHNQGPYDCFGVEVWLQDHIGYDQEQAPYYRTSRDYLFEPGSLKCDNGLEIPNASTFIHELTEELVTARAASYGAPEIAAMADMLDNYALYGQPTPPPPLEQTAFSDWDYMAPVNSYWSRKVTFTPQGDAVPGAKVTDVSIMDPQAWDEHLWRIPNANGGLTPIYHEASGLCLTPSGADLTLEVCDGADDQLWSRGTQDAVYPQDPNVLRHVASGLCLSAVVTNQSLFGEYVSPGLSLKACENQGYQTWAKLNMSWTYGAPRSSSNQMGLAHDGEAVGGAKVSLVDGASAPAWRFSLTHGLFVHEASKLCLTRKAGTENLTLESCVGTAEQLWSKDKHGFIRHLSSGSCLSSVKGSWYDLGILGQTYFESNLLNLAGCENGRTDQIWTDFNNVSLATGL